MFNIHVTIEGTTPLLMNRFNEENEVKISSGVSKVAVGTKGTPREQAEKKAYKDSDGMLYIPRTKHLRLHHPSREIPQEREIQSHDAQKQPDPCGYGPERNRLSARHKGF